MAKGPSDTEPGFQIESKSDARARRNAYIRVLARNGTAESLQLARRFSSCTPHDPCNSGACPVCCRQYRQNLMSGFNTDLGWYRNIQRVSVVPKGGRVAMGELRDFDLNKATAAASKNLERKGPNRAWAIFGVDMSLNERNGHDPYWQFHLYGLAAKLQGDQFGWKGVFPADSRDARPLHTYEVGRGREDRQRVISYLLKSRFFRRSSYIDENNERWNTQSFNLRPNQLVELLLFLDQYPIRTRLIGHRVRIIERRNRLNFQISNRESR